MIEQLGRVLPRPPQADRIPLICLPYAGGGDRSYRSWQHLLPSEVDPLTVRLPGHEGRYDEPLAADLATEALSAAAELAPALTGPFVLFGHSMGAWRAFELARALRGHLHREPACLVVSGSAVPDDHEREPRYEHLGDDELRTEIESMGGMDVRLLRDPEAWAVIRPVVRADLVMCDQYRMVPEEPLGCPIVAYGSHDDSDLSPRRLARWGECTTGPLEQRMFPGDHFFFLRFPEAFAMDLARRLYRLVVDEAR